MGLSRTLRTSPEEEEKYENAGRLIFFAVPPQGTLRTRARPLSQWTISNN